MVDYILGVDLTVLEVDSIQRVNGRFIQRVEGVDCVFLNDLYLFFGPGHKKIVYIISRISCRLLKSLEKSLGVDDKKVCQPLV